MLIYQYTRNLENIYQTPEAVPAEVHPDKGKVTAILKKAQAEGRIALNELEAKSILSCYQMPVLQSEIVQDRQDAARQADKIGYPVVMKILSPQILHKTEVGGVKVGISSPEAAAEAFDCIMHSVRMKSQGRYHKKLLFNQ